MGKKLDIGVNNVARKGKKAWVGVDGKARKVKKMWIGDANGKARLCFSGANPIYFSVSSASTTSEHGIYVSEDELNTIAIAGVGGFASHGGAIVTKDGVEYIVTARPGDINTQGVFYSTDGGNTWTKATPAYANPTSNSENASLVYNDGALWFVRSTQSQYSACTDVYRSTDLVNWTKVASTSSGTYSYSADVGEVYSDRLIIYCNGTTSSYIRGGLIYSIGIDGVQKGFGNNGLSQDRKGKVFTNGVDCSVIAQINNMNNGGTKEWCLYYGNNLETKIAYPFDNTLYQDGATFQGQDFGCYADGTWIYITAASGYIKFYYSTNLKSWTLAQTVDLGTFVAIGPYCTDVKYIDGVVYALMSTTIYCSADKGKTWTKINDCPSVSNKFLRVGTL